MTTAPPFTKTERLIGLEDQQAWDAALEDVPHAFAHTWTHCHAMAASSGHSTYLYRFESAEARIVSPLAERPVGDDVDLVTPYGFSGFAGTGHCPSFASDWWDFAGRQGYVCAYLLLNPVLPSGSWLGDDARPHKILHVLDLRLGEDELFARLSENRRRQVRRADAEPDALVRDGERLTEFFVQTYPDFVARHGARDVYRLCEQSMRELCASPQTLIVGAERAGRLRAVSLFGFTAHAGDYLFNASLPGEESYSVMLIWAAVRELAARGVPTLNLGGGIAEDDSLAEFKRRFGADRVPLFNVKQIYRPDAYAALCASAGTDPATTSYFPAYRTPAT
jgi:hypothetical protein